MRPISSTIWKRRAVLMAVVGLIVAIPLTLALRGGDDDPEPAAPDAEALAETDVPEPELGPSKRNGELDVNLSLPADWKQNQRPDVLVLRSADDRARISISAPGPAEDSDQLHDEVLDGFRKSYAKFDVTKRIDDAKLGGVKARTTAAKGSQKKDGEEIGILISTAEGDKRAYLVVTLSPIADPGQSGLEAQAILNSLEFTG